MEIFTYKDYIKYSYSINRKKDLIFLQDNRKKYHINNINKKIDNEHDKLFKIILEDKFETIKFINNTLNLNRKIKEEEIEKYNSSFITNDLKNKECDIVYKIKDKNIFFLIEHQTTIDYSMSKRILEYEVEIIRSALINSDKIDKNYRLPLVIPIVLYTGKKKWDAEIYLKNIQEKFEDYDNSEIGKYNLVDINDYDEKQLLDEKDILTKAILIEKSKNYEQLIYYLKKILNEFYLNKKYYNNKKINEFLNYISTKIDNITINNSQKEYIKKSIKNLKGEDEVLLVCMEMLEREYIRMRKEGRKQGIKEGKEEGKKEGIKEGIEEGRKEGIKEGIKEGREEGIEEGIRLGKIQYKKKILQSLKKDYYSKKEIEEILKLNEK